MTKHTDSMDALRAHEKLGAWILEGFALCFKIKYLHKTHLHRVGRYVSVM